MTIERLYEIYLRHPSVVTDTRLLKEGDLFFALKGPNFNGNAFALQALASGAAYAVIDEAPGADYRNSAPQGDPGPAATVNAAAAKLRNAAAAGSRINGSSPDTAVPDAYNDRLILVPDVLQALQDLALHHRRQFNIPFIAITGSNGKTTTKELVHAVLSSTYLTYTTKGNLNNHIGIPLTILSVRPDAEFAVIEMGANHQKEIEGYCRYTLPTHGIITNIGKAHLEGFGGPEGVKKGKGELYDWLRDTGGTVFVLNDSADLRQMSRGIAHVITYGTEGSDFTGVVSKGEGSPAAGGPVAGGAIAGGPVAGGSTTGGPTAAGAAAGGGAGGVVAGGPTAAGADTFLNVRITHGAVPGIIHTQLVGDYNLPNVLVAVAVGKHFDVQDARIYKEIEQYTPSNSRSQLIERDGNHIILDAYNANPSSMRAAIENFARIPVTATPAHPAGAAPTAIGGAAQGAAAQPDGAAPTTGGAAPQTSGKIPSSAAPQGAAAQPAADAGTPSPAGTGFDQKILVLGAMAELGPESINEHRAIVSLISQYPWRDVALVGGDFQKIDHPYRRFADSKEAGHWLSSAGFQNVYMLIKGSRSSKMELALG